MDRPIQIAGPSRPPMPPPQRTTSMGGRASIGNDGPDDDAEGEEDGPAGKKRKRNRQALSCTECKRRKINWNEGNAPKSVQPFALRGELEDLRDLIAELHPQAAQRVEELRKRAASNAARVALEARGALPPEATASNEQESFRRQAGTMEVFGRTLAGDSGVARPDPDSDTEDAANTLEGLAMGRMPGNPMEALAGPRSNGKRIGGQPGQPHQPGLSWANTSSQDMASFTPGENVRGPAEWPVDLGQTHLLLSRPSDTPISAAVFRSVLQLVPPDVTLDFLVTRFVTDASLYTSIQLPAFLRELREFKALRTTPASESIDPAWLALLFTIIALGIEGGEHTQQAAELRVNLPAWRDAIGLCLALADWTSTPRYRVIMTLSLHVPIRVQTPLASIHALRVYLSTAFRHAVSLGWHRLGDDPSVMPGPDDDPGLPRGPCLLRRQAVLLLWSSLSFAFLVMSAQDKGLDASTFDHNEGTTQLPYNVNDEDLLALGSRLEIQESPSTVVTDASMARLQRVICEHGSRVRSLFADPSFSYEKLLEIERITRGRTQDLGPLQVGVTPRACVMISELTHSALIAMMSSGINNQLLRMHRPWLARGYRDVRYAHSTKTCIEAAKAIVQATRIYGDAGASLWFLVRHNTGAIIVLSLHLYHLIDHRGSPQAEIDALFVDLDDCQMWLSRIADIGPVQNRSTSLSGVRIIKAMRNGAQQRAQTIQSGKRPRESIAAVVKRIATVLDAEEGADFATPPEPASASDGSPPIFPSTSAGLPLQMGMPGTSDDPLLFLNTGGDGITGNEFSDLFSADLGLFGSTGDSGDWSNMQF